MTMFPPAGAIIYRNADGEVTGWDMPGYDEPEYCDECGLNHGGSCEAPYGYDEEDDDDEED